MTKQTKQLKKALGNDLDSHEVQIHVDYYAEYIDGELKNGRSEEEILNELGDPWVIARSIIDSPVNDSNYSGNSSTCDTYDDDSYNKDSSGYDKMPQWKKVLWIIAAVCILFLVIMLMAGIFRVIVPFIIPVIVVIIIVRMFKK